MRMTRMRTDERGAVLAIVALTLIALFGMAALVIDVGGLLVAKRKMVTAADAAALAAAQECASDPLTHNLGTAQSEALSVASENGATAGRIVVVSGTCPGRGGRVAARYRVPEELSFAPILGLGDSLTVSATAEALWGPARAASRTPPMNLFAGPGGTTFPCAFEAHHPCNFWMDNTDTTSTSSSNWSFLALEPPGWPADAVHNDPGRRCNNSDAGMLPGWTSGLETQLVEIPTYVCAIAGNFGTGGLGPMYNALKAMEGKTFEFPVTDPDLQPPPAQQAFPKFAVVGFTSLRIVQILQGNDPAVHGQSGECAFETHLFSEIPPLNRYNLALLYATCAVTPGVPSGAVIGDPIVRDVPPGNRTFSSSGPSASYMWDSSTRTMTWTDFPRSGLQDVRISLPWGTPGPCGFHTPDPNDFCMITEWRGNQLGGGIPNPNPSAPSFGLGAIRLVD